MTKFIKLTNNFNQLKGNAIYMNCDHITAFYNEVGSDGMERTFVFSNQGQGNTWDVEESVSEIITKIEQCNQSTVWD